ncbi:MAG: BMC domain-containing protein [Treponema sp.]|nr:BMC domain-containing protein [Treponema sp.]
MKAGENHALGIIETAGRAPLIEAVDSAIKAAVVTLKSSYFVGGGVNTVTLVGDVGAMRAALDAAKATFERMGVVGQTHLIPRLAEDVWPLIMDQTNGRDPSPPRGSPGPASPRVAVKRSAAFPDKPPVPAETNSPAESAVPSAPVPEEQHSAPESSVPYKPADLAKPAESTKPVESAKPTELAAVPAAADAPAESAVTPVPAPEEPPAVESAPEEKDAPVPDKKAGDAGPNMPGEMLFPDEMSRSGRKTPAPKKKNSGDSSGKNPRKGNPKSKS